VGEMRKDRKTKIGLILTMVMAFLGIVFLMPGMLYSVVEWDKSSLLFIDDDTGGDCSEIYAVVKNGDDSEAMEDTTDWKLYWVASGNPKSGVDIASGTIPALEPGDTYTMTYNPYDNPNGPSGNYMFWASQRPGHPGGTGELWSEEISLDCSIQPETGCITLYKYYEGPELEEGTKFNFEFNGKLFQLEQNGSRTKCELDLDATYTLEELNDSNGDPHEVIIVDDNGTVLYEGLTPTGKIDITFPEGETNIILYATNDPEEEEPDEKLGTIGIEKVDGAGNILTGAGFTLYNSDKSAVVRAGEMVDAAGKVAFRNLPMGTYIVSETTVPGGYSGMADTPVTINESNVGSVIGITAVNTKPGGEVEVQALTGEVEVQALTGEIEVLAFTGYNTIYYILGFLLILIGGIGSVYLTRMVRRREE
jgi:hypothetical protein